MVYINGVVPHATKKSLQKHITSTQYLTTPTSNSLSLKYTINIYIHPTMGLFKAAIIIGGGAYAIKKLSKSREEKRQCRAAGYDQNMSPQQQQQQQYRDYPDQPQYQNQYYGDEKKNHNHNHKQNQNQGEKTRGLDGGEQRYYDFDPTKQQAVAIHPQALEFVDRRSPSPHQYPPSSQPWRLSNSHKQPLPQANAYAPPPSYHPEVGQQDMKHGFVEPEELSWSGSPPPPPASSEGMSAWDRKGRRESGSGRGGFGNGGAGDWKNSGSVSPKEYLENHLSR